MQDFDPKRVHFVQRSILFRFLNRFEEIREICAICEGIPVQELIQRKDHGLSVVWLVCRMPDDLIVVSCSPAAGGKILSF